MTRLDIPPSQRKAVGIWLLSVAALIAAMVVVGGLTRLTGSGLSITEWHPVTGVDPAAHAIRLGSGIREVQAHPAIPARKPRHEPRANSRRSIGGNGRIACWGG